MKNHMIPVVKTNVPCKEQEHPFETKPVQEPDPQLKTIIKQLAELNSYMKVIQKKLSGGF